MAGDNREAGENPARSRHCDRAYRSGMPLGIGKPGKAERYVRLLSQETCRSFVQETAIIRPAVPWAVKAVSGPRGIGRTVITGSDAPLLLASFCRGRQGAFLFTALVIKKSKEKKK